MDKKFVRWEVQPAELRMMDTKKARDIIIKCFFEAQKETIARAKEKLGNTADDDSILKSVTAIVKTTFTEVKSNFDNPTKEDLMQVIGSLAKKSQGWGTPADIIEHHKKQIEKVLSAL